MKLIYSFALVILSVFKPSEKTEFYTDIYMDDEYIVIETDSMTYYIEPPYNSPILDTILKIK